MAKELTPLQKAFIEALLGDAKGDFKVAKKLAGYADTVSVNEIVKSLKNELREAALDALSMASIKAAFSLEGVLLDPNMAGAGNVLKAADNILSRTGVKVQEDVITAPEGAVLILPEKKVTILKIEDEEVKSAE